MNIKYALHNQVEYKLFGDTYFSYINDYPFCCGFKSEMQSCRIFGFSAYSKIYWKI